MRSNPQLLLILAIVFALLGLLNGANAYRSYSILDGALSVLWLLGAAIWLVRYRVERHWSQGR